MDSVPSLEDDPFCTPLPGMHNEYSLALSDDNLSEIFDRYLSCKNGTPPVRSGVPNTRMLQSSAMQDVIQRMIHAKCQQCGKNRQENVLQRCSQCHFVYYCSSACQHADWSRHQSIDYCYTLAREPVQHGDIDLDIDMATLRNRCYTRTINVCTRHFRSTQVNLGVLSTFFLRIGSGYEHTCSTKYMGITSYDVVSPTWNGYSLSMPVVAGRLRGKVLRTVTYSPRFVRRNVMSYTDLVRSDQVYINQRIGVVAGVDYARNLCLVAVDDSYDLQLGVLSSSGMYADEILIQSGPEIYLKRTLGVWYKTKPYTCCNWCGAGYQNSELKKCSICSTQYCNRQCQASDWVSGHRLVCLQT